MAASDRHKDVELLPDRTSVSAVQPWKVRNAKHIKVDGTHGPRCGMSRLGGHSRHGPCLDGAEPDQAGPATRPCSVGGHRGGVIQIASSTSAKTAVASPIWLPQPGLGRGGSLCRCCWYCEGEAALLPSPPPHPSGSCEAGPARQAEQTGPCAPALAGSAIPGVQDTLCFPCHLVAPTQPFCEMSKITPSGSRYLLSKWRDSRSTGRSMKKEPPPDSMISAWLFRSSHQKPM